MAKFLTLDDLDPKGKIILLRADLNVPMQEGRITDKTRINRLIPTINELCEKGGRVVLISHFGRPKGEKNKSMSLEPLSKSIGDNVSFIDDCIGDDVKSAIKKMVNGDIILLENLRFYEEEEKNDSEFAKKLASLGGIYINDAFSVSHRAHASTQGITKYLPCYAGRLMEAELKALNDALEEPKRPVMAIIGGAKISTKLDLLDNLVKKIDSLVLGGGMANTFLFAIGTKIGKSLCENDMKKEALKIIDTAKKNNCKIILPIDGVAAKKFKADVKYQTVAIDNIASDDMILDIGKGSVAVIEDELRKIKTILWNGPMGAFEIKPFDEATNALAKIVADMTASGDIISVAGGGDTIAALANAGVENKMTYVSTAGGAFLEWLEGKELPGIKALYK